MVWEVEFPGLASQMAGTRVKDDESRRATIVRAVWWLDGTIHDPISHEDVPQGHYHLLDADGVAVGHGDNYIGGAHVVAALEGLLDGRDVPIAEGKPGKVGSEDAALGKVSATGSMHCSNCGAKVQFFFGPCPGCGEALFVTGGED